ncbi:MAG: hypothetical protein GX946_08970 [Oligosphaeraceae bacterium]|nr:hypothetical protein [Oligosphaeraceae bacterium]
MQEHDAAQWYVMQVMTGQEHKVEKALLQLKERAVTDSEVEAAKRIVDVRVPVERVAYERKSGGAKLERDRKLYPGYVFAKLALYKSDDSIDPLLWSQIREINGLIGFIGGEDPVPISDSEVEAMEKQDEEKDAPARPIREFVIGETIVMREGAFENIQGTVLKVDNLKQVLSVSVNMFGSSTVVEVGFGQVDRFD